jgi:hypothetical protein
MSCAKNPSLRISEIFSINCQPQTLQGVKGHNYAYSTEFHPIYSTKVAAISAKKITR